MKNKIVKTLMIVSMAYFILPITTVNAEQTTYGQVLDDLSKAEAELSKNQSSIQSGKNQIATDNKTINNLKDEIVKMGEETTQLQQEIVESNQEIENKKEQTKNVITYLQMSGGQNIYLDYVFGGETITDVVYRMSVVEQITEYNNQVIEDLETLIKNNEDKKIELAAKEKQAEEKIVSLNNEISKLNSNISKLGDAAPSLEQEVKSKRELVNYYKSQGCSNRNDIIGVDCATTSANATFTRPITKGYVTSFIGYRWGSLHRGIDLGSPTGRGTPLYSIGYGVVTLIYTDYYGAKCIVIEYKDTKGQYYSAIYCHMDSYGANMYVGRKVDPNTIVGYMGDTGYAFGVHLHLELWPCRYLADNNCGTWNKYVSFVASKYNQGFRGAESVINFPRSTYQTWYSR